MLAALAATAAIFGGGPGQEAVRELRPATLQPVPGGPRFLDGTLRTELSPNGRRVVALALEGRRFAVRFWTRGGRPRGRVKVRSDRPVLSWLEPDRVALVGRGKPATVTVVRPSTRSVLRREVIREHLGDTARVGRRQVLLTSAERDGEQRLSVFGPGGRLQRSVPLPGVSYGMLHGRTPTGHALVLSNAEPFLYDVDVATGAVTRHDLDIPEGNKKWLEPTAGELLAIDAYGSPVWILDPETFAVVRTVRPSGLVEGAGRGFVSYGREENRRITVYDQTGDVAWRGPRLDVLDAGAFGRRLYAGSGYDDVNVRVFDIASGRLLRTLPGRASLFEPSAGRLRVPFFSSGAINED